MFGATAYIGTNKTAPVVISKIEQTQRNLRMGDLMLIRKRANSEFELKLQARTNCFDERDCGGNCEFFVEAALEIVNSGDNE